MDQLLRIASFVADHGFVPSIDGDTVVFEIPTFWAGQDGEPETYRVRALTAAAIAIGY